MKKQLKLLAVLTLAVSIPLAVWAANAAGTLTADGNTDIDWRPGTKGSIGFSGDFGGGTVTVFYLVGDTYVAFKNTSGAISYTDDDGFSFDGVPGSSIRITLASSTSPDIDYVVREER